MTDEQSKLTSTTYIKCIECGKKCLIWYPRLELMLKKNPNYVEKYVCRKCKQAKKVQGIQNEESN